MAVTTYRVARTVTVGNVGATSFDAADAFGSDRGSFQSLQIHNVHPSAIVSVAWNVGVTAPAPGTAGDDYKHVGPFGVLTIPFPPLTPGGGTRIVSLRSDTAATPVEISPS